MATGKSGIDAETLTTLKHDIKNQLSSITLLIDQLKQEGPAASEDYITYLRMIESSAKVIDEILKSTD